MAFGIGRIAGSMLEYNLDRKGTDLQFSTSGQTLVYMDFTNFRLGVNTAASINETITVNGNVSVANIKFDTNTISSTIGNLDLTSAGNLTLAPTDQVIIATPAKLNIGGGANNYILTTDGIGNLAWQSLAAISETAGQTGMEILLGTPTDGSLTANAAYSYWTPGTFVTDAIDNLNQVMFNVAKNTYVGAANFTANITAGPSPMTVQFTAQYVGNPNAYYWDFGDGNTSTAQNPIHTYNNVLGGVFTVYFKAYNTTGTFGGVGTSGNPTQAQGSYSDITKNNFITLYTPVPISTFSLNVTTIDSGNTVVMTNTSQYAQTYVVSWGDGSATNISANGYMTGSGVNAGGPTGPIIHQFTNLTDTVYQVQLAAESTTSGPSTVITQSAITNVYVYDPISPAIASSTPIGNNGNNSYGNFAVTFNNLSSPIPGPTATFPTNRWSWNFGDGTFANISTGIGANGDIGQAIAHTYTLANAQVQQTFTVSLTGYNGHHLSPFTSNTITVTVKPSPDAQFIGNVVTLSDKTGDTNLVGYLFIDLNGNNRANIGLINTSINSTNYVYNYGDTTTSANIANGNQGSPGNGYLYHTFGNIGNYTIALNAIGPNSLSPSDDTLTRINYVTILAPPSPPAGLSSQTIAYTSVGNAPLLAANANDNSGGFIPAAGTAVNRVTTADPINTSTTSYVYDSSNGTLTGFFNATNDGSRGMTGSGDSGAWGGLVITGDVDAHTLNPAVYPSHFYKVFNVYHSRTNGATPVGFNTTQLTHSTTGNTNLAGFVKDDLTAMPAFDISTATMSVANNGTLKYISSVPYFTTGGQVAINALKVYDWIGQTYLNTASPFNIGWNSDTEQSGAIITTQNKSYAQLDGTSTYLSSGIPLAETGNAIGNKYTLGQLVFNVDGTVAAAGKVQVVMSNVNGASVATQLPTIINLYNTAYTGFDETNIPVSAFLGSGFSDNGKRIVIAGANGATPTFNSATNYYTADAWIGAITIAGTDEAVVRWGSLAANQTDYSVYLPPGPNLTANPTVQYFRAAFRRQTMANFRVTYTGKISGMWFAAPGTQIDSTSTMNKWIDASQVYAGAGIPGANTGAGGNGSDGCAVTPSDIIPIGTVVTNGTFSMTLGSENASNAYGNQILISIRLGPTDYLTSLSFG